MGVADSHGDEAGSLEPTAFALSEARRDRTRLAGPVAGDVGPRRASRIWAAGFVIIRFGPHRNQPAHAHVGTSMVHPGGGRAGLRGLGTPADKSLCYT